MNALNLESLENKNKNKEKSFENLKNKFNRIIAERNNFETENIKNSKYISSLKKNSNESDSRIKVLENSYKELLNTFLNERPKKRKLRFFCF